MHSVIYGDIPFVGTITDSYTSPAATYNVPEIPGQVEVRKPRTYSVSVTPPSVAGKYIVSQTDTVRAPEHDSDSFKSIQNSGLIKMTNYLNSSYTLDNNLLLNRSNAILAIHPWQWVGGSDVNGVPFQTVWYDQGSRKLLAQADFPMSTDQAIANRPFYPHLMFDQLEVDQAVREVKSQLVADTLQSYDLLTDLSELKETIHTAQSILRAVRRPLSAISEFKQSLERKNLPSRRKAQLLTDKWMGYRYGIMPAIYSMQDIVKLVSQLDDVYRTCRAQRNIDVSGDTSSSVGLRDKGAWQKVSGTVKIRGTSKTRFELGQLSRLIDQTSVNFAQTAWELIPYSFVADWFANVGDWLLAHTHLAAPGVTSMYCYSIKKEITRETYVRFHLDKLKSQVSWGLNGVVDTVTEPDWTSTQLARTEKLVEYQRVVFDQSDVDFFVSLPFMSWKRWVDTASLSLSNLNKALRRLP